MVAKWQPYSLIHAQEKAANIEKLYNKYFLVLGLFVLFLVFSALVIYKTIKYEETAYDADAHANSVDITALFFEAKQDCDKEKEDAKRNRCHESVKNFLDRHIPIRDLGAQDTMARATRGILWISALQALVGFVTALFLFWTVLQTRLILFQSKEATYAALRSAEAAVDTAKAAENAERAYLVPKFEVLHGEKVDGFIHAHKQRFWVECSLVNAGKTPAYDIKVGFYQGHSTNIKNTGITTGNTEIGTESDYFCIPVENSKDIVKVVKFPKVHRSGFSSCQKNSEWGSGVIICGKWSYRSIFSKERVEEEIWVQVLNETDHQHSVSLIHI